ncbi:LysE/ArgO family amino acid transporter [Orrella daihaiensis]|uniref:LysE family transporter n=1 Tax=Orrella daihaiensis TaxID=2782176 RepID=A0ABY4AK34_9BURK|nr:LysE family transporter [Orrella daihaiensis]UOD50438.1 LysE family transporter [Orrella daihaiensis]
MFDVLPSIVTALTGSLAAPTLPAFSTAFLAGMALSLSLIMAIGPQNAHLLRMGLSRQHLWLTVVVCVIADMALIAVGVIGLGQLGQLSDRLYGALLGATVLVLLIYGWQAARRFWEGFWRGFKVPAQEVDRANQTVSRRQAVTAALTFSWLNPHAWIDTAVLIGGASLAYQADARTGFGVGAMVGSLIWFVAFGALAWWMGKRLGQTSIWRWMDGLVAIMMWAIAATIALDVVS